MTKTFTDLLDEYLDAKSLLSAYRVHDVSCSFHILGKLNDEKKEARDALNAAFEELRDGE